jgi:hypothetical protein
VLASSADDDEGISSPAFDDDDGFSNGPDNDDDEGISSPDFDDDDGLLVIVVSTVIHIATLR